MKHKALLISAAVLAFLLALGIPCIQLSVPVIKNGAKHGAKSSIKSR